MHFNLYAQLMDNGNATLPYFYCSDFSYAHYGWLFQCKCGRR